PVPPLHAQQRPLPAQFRRSPLPWRHREAIPPRAPENTAKTTYAQRVTFRPATPAKSDNPRQRESINRPFLSASAALRQRQSVSPIADRHTRIIRGGIGTRCAYIPHARAASHGCRRTEAVGPPGT